MCDRCSCVFVAPCLVFGRPVMMCSDCAALYNAEICKGTVEMAWARAVSEWNKGQLWRDELYGIPKKGSEYYEAVKHMMGEPIANKIVEPKQQQKKPYPEIPSWDDLVNIDTENGTDYWTEKLIVDFSEKKWAIPMLPKPSREASLVQKKFPNLTNTQVNKILKGANDARRAAKKE